MGWQDQEDDFAAGATGLGTLWVDFCAALIGAGATLLLLHTLGALALVERWATFL